MKIVIAAACFAAVALGFMLGFAAPASAQTAPRADPQFIGIDLDHGSIYYNGRNSGRYCIYQTVRVFNRYTGYYENRRARRCGRGLYFR